MANIHVFSFGPKRQHKSHCIKIDACWDKETLGENQWSQGVHSPCQELTCGDGRAHTFSKIISKMSSIWVPVTTVDGHRQKGPANSTKYSPVTLDLLIPSPLYLTLRPDVRLGGEKCQTEPFPFYHQNF